jgi:hypothetical protein
LRLLTNSENHFSNPLQRPYSGDFDPENAFRKPHLILITVPDAIYVMYSGENLPIDQWQSRKKDINFEVASGKIVRIEINKNNY